MTTELTPKRYKITQLVGALLFMAIAGCAVPPPTPAEVQRQETRARTVQMVADARRQSDAQRVNEHWSASCMVDAVNTVRTCRAATFGATMTSAGTPLGSANIPFQIIYFDERGPFVMVGFNTFPGRDPALRVDDGRPMTITKEPQPNVVSALAAGKIARARFYVWPSGARDMFIELGGIKEALARLDELRASASSPAR